MLSPNVPVEERQLVERYFKGMQAGPDGVEDIVGLFTEDGEYVEPFSAQGRASTHRGSRDIRAFFEESLNGPLREGVRLTLERLDYDGNQLRSQWTCVMPMFPGPLRGFDMYTFETGKIKRLEVVVTDMPPMR
jgi:hypothetical protein